VTRVLTARKSLLALCVLFCLSLLICGIAYASGATDIKGNWAAADIEKALATGYVKGYPDGSFRPDAGVTRAEFVAMVDSAFQVPVGQTKNTFKDVHSTDWFARDVQSALAAGFVSGFPDGTFGPQKAIDRQDGASIVAKLLNLSGGGSLSFSDAAQIDAWAKPSIAELIAKGIMSGYPDNTFRPQKVISRAEAVVMINKALSYQFTPVTTQLQVAGDYVNVRSGPSTKDPVIGQAQPGDTFQATAITSDDWYQIDYQGMTGWVAGWCVQASQPTTVSSQSSQTTQSTPTAPVNQATGTTTQTNPIGTTTQTSPSTGTNGINQGNLNVQVEQVSTGTIVDITGAQGAYQYTEQTNPQSLLVTVPGITAVQSQSEIDIGSGGLDKIITTLPMTTPGTTTSGTTSGITTTTAPGNAQVVISFTVLPTPLTYSVAKGAPGELLITLPPQIYQVQATPISDFVAVNIAGTVSLCVQPSQSAGSSKELVFDITGATLNPALQSWSQTVNAMGVGSLTLSQHTPNVVRLVAQVSPDVFYTSETSAGGTQFTLWLQEPEAKQALLANPSSGNVYYGIDLALYPGDSVMQAWWKSSPFCYTGFYLGPSVYHSDASFMYKRQVLINQGWGLLPIYVGRQADSEHLDTPTGVADANEAVDYAVYNNFPRNTTIYLDIETGSSLAASYMNYVTTWANEIQIRGYDVGIYCSAKTANQIRSALPAAAFWVAHYAWDNLPSSALNPADTGVSYASSWQFTGDSSLTYGGYPLTVDLDASTSPDP
jgi:uncharacterized protein YraI